jgi:hypothetical protein
MTALVRGVIAFSTLAGSMHQVSALTSTSTAAALTSRTAPAVACQVSPGTITSSPNPTPQASRASCNDTVPLATDTAYLAPTNSAKALLNCRSFGPLYDQTPLLKTSSRPFSSFLSQKGHLIRYCIPQRLAAVNG